MALRRSRKKEAAVSWSEQNATTTSMMRCPSACGGRPSARGLSGTRRLGVEKDVVVRAPATPEAAQAPC